MTAQPPLNTKGMLKMIYELLFLILFAILFPKALRFLFALSLVGAVVLLGEAHAYDGSRTLRRPLCETTSIKEIGTRLQGETPEGFDPGSSVVYSNGTTGISYERIRELDHSRVGDRVNLCLISVPKGCPRGDIRGREYIARNLRTNEHWRMMNDEHLCGGA
jgi:hypothetical protein